MIPGVVIKPIQKYDDNRGWLAEFFRSDQVSYRPEMAYVSETLSGIVRGPHEHIHQSDFFIFLIGSFTLYLWDNRQGAENYRVLEKIEVGEGNPCSVIVPPGVVHAYRCTSEKPGLTINMPDKLYKGPEKKEEVDEIRWETDLNSPFKI